MDGARVRHLRQGERPVYQRTCGPPLAVGARIKTMADIIGIERTSP
jgi:hypothetical protein